MDSENPHGVTWLRSHVVWSMYSALRKWLNSNQLASKRAVKALISLFLAFTIHLQDKFPLCSMVYLNRNLSKRIFWHVRPTKPQISLCIYAV